MHEDVHEQWQFGQMLLTWYCRQGHHDGVFNATDEGEGEDEGGDGGDDEGYGEGEDQGEDDDDDDASGDMIVMPVMV